MKIERLKSVSMYMNVRKLNEQHPKGVGYEFIRNAALLRGPASDVENDLLEIRKSYADKTADGKPITVSTDTPRGSEERYSYNSLTPELRAEMTEQIEKLYKDEIDIELKQVKLQNLKNLDSLDNNAIADLLGTIIIDDESTSPNKKEEKS